MLKRKLFGLFFGLLALNAAAQDAVDTTIMLHEISINSYRFAQFSDGNKQQKIDSVTQRNHQTSTLSEVLSSATTIYLKSYGVSGNTSISLRGATASQTAVLWNGINIQDPLNGGTSLELIPLAAINKIQLQFGGSGALFGSGAIGGAIILESQVPYETGFKADILAGIGSFNNYFGQVSVQQGNKNAAASLHFYYRQGENDFPYTNTALYGHPQMRQTNAALKYTGISQDSRFKTGKNQQLNTHLWIQKSFRELPPNMSNLVSRQSQEDELLRFSSDWSLQKVRTDWMIRLGALHSKLQYTDSISAIYATHKSNSALIESEVNYAIRSGHKLNFGIHERMDWGISENYAQTQQRNSLAFLLSYRHQSVSKKLAYSVSIRQEHTNKKWSPPTPAFGADLFLGKHFRLNGKVSYNYRQPTFNDLFWEDGYAHGNPDLKPESAWAQDLSISYFTKTEKQKLNFSITAFNAYTRDLILWIPIENIWTPTNQKEVWARGLEADFSYSLKRYLHRFSTQIHYSYTPSTIAKVAESESTASLYKQLIYTPLHQARGQIGMELKWMHFFMEQVFVGRRYTTTDNRKWLNEYGLTNLIFEKSITLKKHIWSLRFSANNLFNQSYQSMENYAMPGRNYQLTIHYNFKKQ